MVGYVLTADSAQDSTDSDLQEASEMYIKLIMEGRLSASDLKDNETILRVIMKLEDQKVTEQQNKHTVVAVYKLCL